MSPKAFAVTKYFLNLVKIDFHDVKWATISEIQQCLKKKTKQKQNQCMIACKNDKSYSLVFFFKPEMYFD